MTTPTLDRVCGQIIYTDNGDLTVPIGICIQPPHRPHDHTDWRLMHEDGHVAIVSTKLLQDTVRP